LYSEGALTALGVPPYTCPAGGQHPQLPVVVNLPAIPTEETPAPVQVTEEIAIIKAENAINMKIDNMMNAFGAWTLQLSKANERRYGGYQTAREYTIQANHPFTHVPMNFPAPNAPIGLVYYRLGSNSQ